MILNLRSPLYATLIDLMSALFVPNNHLQLVIQCLLIALSSYSQITVCILTSNICDLCYFLWPQEKIKMTQASNNNKSEVLIMHQNCYVKVSAPSLWFLCNITRENVPSTNNSQKALQIIYKKGVWFSTL